MLESKYLKDNIQNIQKLLTIPALRHFETSNLGKLLRLSKIREYKDGELLIEEGDLDPWLYFLLSGKIRIVKEGKNIATISQKGEIFGEMRIVDSLSRSASVYAAGTTICLAWIPPPKKDSPLKERGTKNWIFCCFYIEFLLNICRSVYA